MSMIIETLKTLTNPLRKCIIVSQCCTGSGSIDNDFIKDDTPESHDADEDSDRLSQKTWSSTSSLLTYAAITHDTQKDKLPNPFRQSHPFRKPV